MAASLTTPRDVSPLGDQSKFAAPMSQVVPPGAYRLPDDARAKTKRFTCLPSYGPINTDPLFHSM